MSNAIGIDAEFEDPMHRSSLHAVSNSCNSPRPWRWDCSVIGWGLSCELLCVSKTGFTRVAQGVDQANYTIGAVSVGYGSNHVRHLQRMTFDPLCETTRVNGSREIPLFFRFFKVVGAIITRVVHEWQPVRRITAINHGRKSQPAAHPRKCHRS